MQNTGSYFETFIKSLSNRELAFYYKYNFENMMSRKKERLANEIEKRGISDNQIKTLTEKQIDHNNTDNEKHCERCGGQKFFNEVDYDYKVSGRYNTAKVATTSKMCMICGYNPLKEPPTSFLVRINQFFRRRKNSKVVEIIRPFE